MKFEYRSLICKITSVVCFGLFLFLLSKFVLQGFGSINHLAVFGLNQNLGGGKIISIIAFAIFLSFFVSSKFSFYLIVFPIAFLSALYSPIASVYGAPDYQSFVSLLATNFSEATEFLSLIPMKEYGKSLGSSAKYVIFPNRPSEALFSKNLTGIFHRGGIDQSLINQFPPS